MGFLNIANDMVNNSTNLLDNMLSSKFTEYLQGNGTPMMVTYYNIDDTVSTTDTGNFTIDQTLGPNSPLRYNKIENFPVYGLKELIPSIEELEGNLYDLSIEGEVIILPNTIKPTPYDYMVYKYLDDIIIFTVNNVELTSIRNNNYYKININLKDLHNPEYEDKLQHQTVAEFTTKTDNIGTQNRCIIENKVIVELNKVYELIDHLIEYYLDMFYDERYNSILYRGGMFGKDYPIYDPILTKFITDNCVLDTRKKFIHLVNVDYRRDVDKFYNRSLYKCLENHNISKLDNMYMEPVGFRTIDTNPFAYYGEEVVFTLQLYDHGGVESPDCKRILYGNRKLYDQIKSIIPKIFNDPDGVVLCTTYEEGAINNEEDEDYGYTVTTDEIDNSYKLDDDDVVDTIYEDDDRNYLLKSASNEDYSYSTDIDDILTENTQESDEPEEKYFDPDYLKFIYRFFNNTTLYELLDSSDVTSLSFMDIENNYTDFIHIPILIHVLKEYVNHMINNKLN